MFPEFRQWGKNRKPKFSGQAKAQQHFSTSGWLAKIVSIN